MAKQSQKDIVLSILKRDGQISRNWCANTMLTLRLASIINILKKRYNYVIKTDETTVKGDTLYHMECKRVEAYNIVYPDGTKELVSKKIWQ